MLESIKTRMPGGYFYERIKYLKKYEKTPILKHYLDYCIKSYFGGGKNISKSTFFDKKEYVMIEDLKLPQISGHAIGTFWCEFPDLVLPYVIEKKGRKYNFSEIDKLMVEGPYELNENVSIKEGNVVVDCGANIGLFSAIAGKKSSLVYAFEPDREIIKLYLEKTKKWNQNIQIQPYALSSNCGKAVFSRNKDDMGGGSLMNSKSDDTFEVETITLDQFAIKNKVEKIDFIKADIEGAERELLLGATEVMRKMHPKLSICTYHLPDDPEVLQKIVLDSNPNYIIEHKYKKMYAYVPENM